MQKMRQCALNFLVKTGNKRNRSSSLLLLVGFFSLTNRMSSDAMQKTTRKSPLSNALNWLG